MDQWLTNPSRIHEDAGWILASPSGSGIWGCHELWCQVADTAQIPHCCGCGVGHSCSSDQTWELPHEVGAVLKKKKKKKIIQGSLFICCSFPLTYISHPCQYLTVDYNSCVISLKIGFRESYHLILLFAIVLAILVCFSKYILGYCVQNHPEEVLTWCCR